MAAVAQPTWREVQTLDPETLEALNVVKGEMNGDEFLWDYEYWDEEGRLHTGAWKSWAEKREKAARETE